MTWADVAQVLRVSPRHARRVAKEIGLRPVVLGHRTVRFKPEAVEAALRRQGL
jgi:excisionase family DNA binding protein